MYAHIYNIATLQSSTGAPFPGFGSAPGVKPGAHGCREEGALAQNLGVG